MLGRLRSLQRGRLYDVQIRVRCSSVECANDQGNIFCIREFSYQKKENKITSDLDSGPTSLRLCILRLSPSPNSLYVYNFPGSLSLAVANRSGASNYSFGSTFYILWLASLPASFSATPELRPGIPRCQGVVSITSPSPLRPVSSIS